MIPLNPLEADKVLQQTIGKIDNCQAAVEQFIHFFETYKVKEELAHDEEDMLLFQYGKYSWNPLGQQFELDLTRQFEMPHQEEYLQLRLTLLYDEQAVGSIEPFNSWSADFDSLLEWQKQLEQTTGFQKVRHLSPKTVRIQLDFT